MIPIRHDTAIEYLWEQTGKIADGYLYGLLDCARNDRIYPILSRSDAEYRCLFKGAIAHELAAASPHIARFHLGSRMLRWLIEEGWGDSWGIFFASDARLIALQDHFREFLTACDEDGAVFYFRFYDPRVMRLYLPTCLEKELRTVFGPVRAFFIEAENDEEFEEYRFDGSRLLVDTKRVLA